MASGDRQDRVGIVVLASWANDGTVDAAALRATLQSLRDQTHGEFEVVVVHRGELDLESDDPRIRAVLITEPGPVALLGAGLAECSAPWIRFLPVGDRLAPGCLAADLAALDRAPDVAAVFCGTEKVDASGAVLASSDAVVGPAGGRHAAGTLLPEVVERNPWPLGAGLLDRGVLAELGGFDASLVARPEHELWIRLLTGYRVLVLADADAGLRLREPPEELVGSEVDGAEHARILVRLLRDDCLEAAVRALGGGARTAGGQGIARAELARRLLRTDRVELRPLAHRLVREARGAGAYFPSDAPFGDLAAHAPELVRPDGWFAAATSPPTRSSGVAGAPPVVFPPPVRVALGTADDASVDEAGPLLLHAAALAERGVELVVLHASAEGTAAPDFDGTAEILRHAGSTEEVEAVLARLGAAVLIADPSHPASPVAARWGLPVRRPVPRVDGPADLDRVARALIREAASHSAHYRRSTAEDSVSARRVAGARAVDEATLRTLARALGDAASAAHVPSDGRSLLDRLADARRDADAARRKAREVDSLAGRALDKLRIGRRLRETLRSESAAGGVLRAPVVSLDMANAERFLEATASTKRLWVLYTTDPYCETKGQRSTWLARELLARGDAVVFLYWRWDLAEPIAGAAHERLLPVPIDQFFRLQRSLMDLSHPGLQKVLLIEFPDVYLFEQIDYANTHGFTTVYDCVDDWEEFARVGQAHWYDPGVERHIVCNADVVLATHPVLAGRLEAMGRAPGSVPVVPNGVALDSLANAPARSREGAPMIGYFGHLTPAWFDWDLIRETAVAHSQWTFDIIGHGAPDDLDVPANVHVLGPVPHEALEERTREWHVGIVPFRPGRLTQAVDPIKLYEYLALGLPSVVVDMPHLAGVPGVEVCTRDGFGDAVSRALGAELDRTGISAFVSASRWSVRTDRLCDAVARVGPRGFLEAL